MEDGQYREGREYCEGVDWTKATVLGTGAYSTCYQARDVELPRPEEGDILAIHDTGAYTMSMYCKFNSILASPVYGYWREAGQVKFVCYKTRETVEECLQFWGLESPQTL